MDGSERAVETQFGFDCGGFSFFLVGSIAQLFGQSALVVSLFDAIAGTCAIIWILATILALLVSQPQEQESVQA